MSIFRGKSTPDGMGGFNHEFHEVGGGFWQILGKVAGAIGMTVVTTGIGYLTSTALQARDYAREQKKLQKEAKQQQQ